MTEVVTQRLARESLPGANLMEHTICVTSHNLPDESFIYHYVVTIGERILVAGNARNYRNAWLWALTVLNGHVGNLGL